MKKDGIIKRIADKLSKNKKLEYCVYAAIFAAAFIIFAATGGISCGEKKNGGSYEYPNNDTEPGEARSESEIESALETILSRIEGAGKVKVMIVSEAKACESGASDDQDVLLIGSGLLYGTGQEGRNKHESIKISGVIVVASGADDLLVRSELADAVKTLLGIEAGRIGVYAMEP